MSTEDIRRAVAHVSLEQPVGNTQLASHRGKGCPQLARRDLIQPCTAGFLGRARQGSLPAPSKRVLDPEISRAIDENLATRRLNLLARNRKKERLNHLTAD